MLAQETTPRPDAKRRPVQGVPGGPRCTEAELAGNPLHNPVPLTGLLTELAVRSLRGSQGDSKQHVVLARYARNRRLADASYQWAFANGHRQPRAPGHSATNDALLRHPPPEPCAPSNRLVGILHGCFRHGPTTTNTPPVPTDTSKPRDTHHPWDVKPLGGATAGSHRRVVMLIHHGSAG